MLLCPDKRDGPPRSRPVGAFALIVFDQSAIGIVRRAHVIRIIGAPLDVGVEHSYFALRRALKSGLAQEKFLRGHFALRLAPKHGLAQDKISLREILEAGGVEPPSEKRYGPKPTCLSHSICFAGRAWNAQDAPPASPIVLAGKPRTETPRPAYCVTPRSEPAGEARGDELPSF